MALHAREHRRFRAFAARLAGGLAALAACGGCPQVQPPPDTVDARRTPAFEHMLSASPLQLVSPDSVVALALESGEAVPGDLGGVGADEFAIFVQCPEVYELRVELDDELPHALAVYDFQGRELGRRHNHEPPLQITLAAGIYIVRIEHGDPANGALRGAFVHFQRGDGNVAPDFGAAKGRAQTAGTPWGQLYATHACDGCDLSGAAPSASTLFSYLEGARLTNCKLDGLVFPSQEFRSITCDACTFVGTDFTLVSFDRANISNSNLTRSVGLASQGNSSSYYFDKCDFSGMDFAVAGGQMTGLRFSSSNLSGAVYPPTTALNATGCNLSNGDFTKVTSFNAQLRTCDLRGSRWPSTLRNAAVCLDDVTLSGVDLTGVSFSPDESGSRDQVFCSATELSNVKLDGANLSGMNLSNARLRGVDLTGASLAGAVLSQTALNGCTLRNISLAGLTLQGATITNCDLSNSNWSGASFAALRSLAGCNFSHAVLAGAALRGVDLSGANFSDASFSSATGTADLSTAKLDGASFQRADLSHATLIGASAHGANFAFANLLGANLSQLQAGVAIGDLATRSASFSFAYMVNANLQSADLRSADLSGAHLYGEHSNLNHALLDRASFAQAVLSSADFGTASLVDAVLTSAQAVNCSFVGADLTNAKFDSAYLQGANLTQAVLHGTNFANAAFSTGAGSWSFRDQDGLPYSISFGATAYDPGATATCNCPDGGLGGAGGCTAARLTPQGQGPFPPVPSCVPSPSTWCPKPAR